MILKKDLKRTEIKNNMREGKGDIAITHITGSEILGKNCRLFAEIVVKPGDSIGNHQHNGEQEIFYFLRGNGIVTDNGETIEIGPGDVMVTPDKSSHSVKNTGNEDLVFIGLILNSTE